ncbi:MAG: hypothetical protein KAI66_01695 [Lentisphaeria bacterium]|nr:hypothetical protein [Lentisphaeria bacterium]
MKKQVWVRKAESFEEAEEMEWQDYLSMTKAERLTIVQQLREEFEKFGGEHARREGLRRTARIVQQA